MKEHKAYAKSNNTSLSKMIEIYFETLTGKAEEKICTTPLVKSLSGVIELPEDFDFKNARTKHLLEKHK